MVRAAARTSVQGEEQTVGQGAARTARRVLGVGATALTLGVLVGCGGPAAEPQPSTGSTGVPSITAPSPETPASSEPGSSPSVVQPVKDQVTVKISIANGQVDPNGTKLDVALGSTVVLEVSSDADDEIHAHTGGDGYELEVKAGQPTTGRFVVSDPGSFEVESHHLEKTIVILNVR